MRDARGVMRGMSLERAEPFWTHMSAYKLQKSLEMGNFGNDMQHTGVQGNCVGKGDRGGVRQECWSSSERSERGRVSRAV